MATEAELVQSINAFYESAWDKLIYVVSAFGAIFGVIIPIASQFYQKRLVCAEEARLQSLIKSEIEAAKLGLMKELSECNKKEIEINVKKIDDSIDELKNAFDARQVDLNREMGNVRSHLKKELAAALGAVYHVQANHFLSLKIYAHAYTSAIDSMYQYALGMDRQNLRVIGEVMIESIMPGLNSESVASFESSDSVSLTDVIDLIKEKTEPGEFSKMIEHLKNGYASAKKRVVKS